MAKKTKGGIKPRKSRSQFSPDKLQSLELLYGSQKAAAEKLGISQETFRDYKNGKKAPAINSANKAQREKARDVTKKINSLYSRNKTKFEKPEFVEKLTKRKASNEKRSQTLKRKASIKKMWAGDWIQTYFKGEPSVLILLPPKVPELAAFDRNDPQKAQFMDASDMREGKPAGVKRVTLFGLFFDEYEWNFRQNLVLKVFAFTHPFTRGVDQAWGIAEANAQFEEALFSISQRDGKHKYQPIQYIGYQLKGR